MADWLEQYSAALDIRDAREQGHKDVIDACKCVFEIDARQVSEFAG